MLLDDLQWSDEATLEVLAALAESVTASRLLIVGSYRSDGLPRGHGLRRLRNDLRRAGRLEEIALPPFGLAETRELVARVLPLAPEPDLVRAIHDRTEGVPFFARELAVALCVSGALREGPAGLELAGGGAVPLPDTIRDAVMIRVAELGDGARRAIEAAAVAGTSFDLRVVAEIAGEGALTELLETQLVREDGATGTFATALVREALYADLPWMARRSLHRALAEALGAPRRARPRGRPALARRPRRRARPRRAACARPPSRRPSTPTATPPRPGGSRSSAGPPATTTPAGPPRWSATRPPASSPASSPRRRAPGAS